MKTKTLIACLITGLLAFGQPAGAARPSFESRQQTRQAHRPARLPEQTASGVIPRAIRGGDPLQLLNPLAPARYGTSRENISVDPNVPGKVDGIILYSIPF